MKLALSLLLMSSVASAHAVDHYVQSSTVALTPSGAQIELRLVPGALVANALLAHVDNDADGAISAREARAYGLHVVRDLSFTVDGRRVPLALERVTVPPHDALDGTGAIELVVVADAPLSEGEHHIALRNDHAPIPSAYLSNVLVPESERIEITTQSHDMLQRRLDVGVVLTPAHEPHHELVLLTLVGLVVFGLALKKRAVRPA